MDVGIGAGVTGGAGVGVVGVDAGGGAGAEHTGCTGGLSFIQFPTQAPDAF